MAKEPKKEIEKESQNNIYEVSFLLVPAIAESELGKEFSAIKGVIEKAGGTFISEDTPKLKVLAYEIKKKTDNVYHKYTSGYFGWVKFEFDNSNLVKLEKSLETNANVIRFLIIRTVKDNTMIGLKVATKSENVGKTRKTDAPVGSEPKIDEAEVDRTIEELVAE